MFSQIEPGSIGQNNGYFNFFIQKPALVFYKTICDQFFLKFCSVFSIFPQLIFVFFYAFFNIPASSIHGEKQLFCELHTLCLRMHAEAFKLLKST